MTNAKSSLSPRLIGILGQSHKKQSKLEMLAIPNNLNSTKVILRVNVQTGLVICGLGIRGFDYLQTRKQGQTANNE